jgi:hypothetical protein
MNKIKEIKNMNTEEFTKTETTLFAKFLAWINKQFIAEQKEYKDAPAHDVAEVENKIDNNQNSDTMEKEELVKKLAEIGYEMEPEEEKEEMSEEELLKMAEEMGMKPKKKAMKEEEKEEVKEEVKAENKADDKFKSLQEEIARLKAAQNAQTIKTDAKADTKNKTRAEIAKERFIAQNEDTLNALGKKLLN